MIFSVLENKDAVLFALKDFEKEKPTEIPTVLEQYIEYIARSGETLFEWDLLKPLFVGKLEKVAQDFYADMPTDQLPPRPNTDNPTYKELKKRIFSQIDQFSGTPFTIQRLCELISNSKKHYKRPDKFLRGVERACMIVSTVDTHGNKIHTTDPRFSGSVGSVIVNGTDNELWPASHLGRGSFSPPLSAEEDRCADGIINNGADGNLNEYRTCATWGRSLPQHAGNEKQNSAEDQPEVDIDSVGKTDFLDKESGSEVSCNSDSTEQLRVTVTIPAEAVDQVKYQLSEPITTTVQTTVCGGGSDELRAIGKLEAFVHTVSGETGFVERLARHVTNQLDSIDEETVGSCSTKKRRLSADFDASSSPTIASGDDDMAASPAKRPFLMEPSSNPPVAQETTPNLKGKSDNVSTIPKFILSEEPIVDIPAQPQIANNESSASDVQPTIVDVESTVAETEPSIADAEPSVPNIELPITATDSIVTDTDPIVNDTDPTIADSEPPATDVEPTAVESEAVIAKIETKTLGIDLPVADAETTVSRRDEESGETVKDSVSPTSVTPSATLAGNPSSSNIDMETGEQE